MFDLLALKNRIQKEKGKKEHIESEIVEKTNKLEEQELSLISTEKAKAILIQAAFDTQKELEVHISNVVSAALKTVFDEPYDFVLEFVERRGKTEADLYFVRDEYQLDPFTSAGLGVVDIASCALRIACWGMSRSKYRNILLLDEPFKHLSFDLQNKASFMLQKLSKDTGVQIIYISHVSNTQGIIKNADKVFKVQSLNGISSVKSYLPEDLLKAV